MIETIYSNDREGNPTNRVQASFRMPKNVRQIGKSNATKKIYVEDYVMTYIKQLAGGDFSKCKIAVLVGQCIRVENCRNIFVSGAVEVSEIDPTVEITFSNDIWTSIYEEIKKYFVETEIVGWFIGGPGYLLEDMEKISKAHIDNFAGQDKTLLTYDNMEKEEVFYSYENNRLSKLEGYYIYYERNEEMQTYMIEHKEVKEQSNEANYDDRVSREIRTILQTKKQPQEEGKNITRLMYAAGTLLAVIVLIVGAAILNNYDQMKSMQDTLNYLSQNLGEVQSDFSEDKDTTTGGKEQAKYSKLSESGDNAEASSNADTGENSLDVEAVPGDVEPIEEEQAENPTEENDEVASNAEDDEEDNNPVNEEELAEEETEDATNQEEADVEDNDEVVEAQVKYYTVVDGDTLAGISYKLYSTYTKVAAIMEMNNIENKDVIYVGQKLIVP